jgi:type III pantothenate kinase
MKQLVIDAGNTRIKLAIFMNNEIIWQDSLSVLSLLYLNEVVAEHNPEATIVSSVVGLDPELVKFIDLLPNAMILDDKTAIPLKNEYGTPASLGRDRLANAAGAVLLYKNHNVLVVDAGTCLKFDFIEKNGSYKGGSISPGLNMRYEALHRYTAQLPLLTPVENTPQIGTSTESSIHSGVLNGMIAEITGVIQVYRSQYDNITVIITGGDMRYFLNHLKKPIFAIPELTLKGLHFILLHNCTQ